MSLLNFIKQGGGVRRAARVDSYTCPDEKHGRPIEVMCHDVIVYFDGYIDDEEQDGDFEVVILHCKSLVGATRLAEFLNQEVVCITLSDTDK